MRWDGMYCARRSRAAGAPRLGEGWHSQVHVCPCLGKLRHPSTLDGMVWYGMAAGAPRLGEGLHTQVHVCLSHDKLRHPYTLDEVRWYGMVWYGMVT